MTLTTLAQPRLPLPPGYRIELEGQHLADPYLMRQLLVLMGQASTEGGAAAHWGGPSALCEVISAVHSHCFSLQPWSQYFNLVNDIGHAENAFYALRALYQMAGLEIGELKRFRSFGSRLTGHGEQHLFPETVTLSNGPLGSAFPQALGLAMADALKQKSGTAERTTLCFLSDGAFMEGEVKEAFSTAITLAQKNKLAPFVTVLSFNNTKLSGRIDQDCHPMRDEILSLGMWGWNILECQQGHDLKVLQRYVKEAILSAQEDPHRPVLLLLHTVKGKGLKATEEAKTGGHGYPFKKGNLDFLTAIEELEQQRLQHHLQLTGKPAPEKPEALKLWIEQLTDQIKNKKISTQKNLSSISFPEASDKKEKIQVGIAQGMIAAKLDHGLPVFSISSDLASSTGVAGFQQQYPDCFIDVGVAESSMVSLAAGLSKGGFVPVVDTFAAFGVTKGNLPLIMSSLSQCSMVAVFSHMGFQDAADGASHQSLTYASALQSIPGINLVAPNSSGEAKVMMIAALKRAQRQEGSTVFFIGREDAPTEYKTQSQSQTQAKTVGQLASLIRPPKHPNSGLIVTYGHLVQAVLQTLTDPELVAAHPQLKDIGLISVNTLNRINPSDWTTLLGKPGARPQFLLFIEEHQRRGGIGSFFFSELSAICPLQHYQQGPHNREVVAWRALGVEESFGQSAYQAMELYEHHGLAGQKLVTSILTMLGIGL